MEVNDTEKIVVMLFISSLFVKPTPLNGSRGGALGPPPPPPKFSVKKKKKYYRRKKSRQGKRQKTGLHFSSRSGSANWTLFFNRKFHAPFFSYAFCNWQVSDLDRYFSEQNEQKRVTRVTTSKDYKKRFALKPFKLQFSSVRKWNNVSVKPSICITSVFYTTHLLKKCFVYGGSCLNYSS